MVGAAMSTARLADTGKSAEDLAVERALLAIRARKRAAAAFPTLMMSGAIWDVLLELFIYRASNLDAEAELVTSGASPRDIMALKRRGIVREGAKPATLTLGDGAFESMQAVLAA